MNDKCPECGCPNYERVPSRSSLDRMVAIAEQLAQAKARNAELERVVDRVLALVELAKCPLPVTGRNELISVAVPFRFLNDFYELREAAEAKVKP